MPKIIDDLPRKLMDEARRQISQSGYGAMTIRSVAMGCGVGVGTVYNYYPSKDALVASFLLIDWKECLHTIRTVSEAAAEPAPVLRSVYDSLRLFLNRHSAIFQDAAAAAGFSGSFGNYHGLLRSQLAEPLKRFCPDPFTAEFIAEAMLVWTVNGTPFEELNGILTKLF